MKINKSFCRCFTGPGGRFSRKESPWSPKAKGKEEKAKETAKRMLEKGFDLDTIVDITGLQPSDIERLREISS